VARKLDSELTLVTTTVTASVSDMPLLVAASVTTDVTIFVVGAAAEASIIVVMTLADPSTVVVKSVTCVAVVAASVAVISEEIVDPAILLCSGSTMSVLLLGSSVQS